MRIKIIVYYCVALVSTMSLFAQTTFNKEVKIMDFITSEGYVLSYEDTIVCIGRGTDYYSYINNVYFVAKFDLEGNLIKRTIDTLGDYYLTHSNDAFIEGNKLIFTVNSYVVEEGGFWGSYLIVMDVHSFEILNKIPITNPIDKYKYSSVTGLTKIDSVTYAIVALIDEEKKVNGKQYIDQQINIINIETGKVKCIQLGKKGVNDIPSSIVWTGKKFLIGTFIVTPRNIFKPFEKREARALIYEVDTSGIWREVFVTDMHSAVGDLIINKDGDYIFTSAQLVWYNRPNTDEYIFHHHKIVYKLDKDFNVIWVKPYGLRYDFNYSYGYAGILPAEEGDGYILAGYQPNFSWTNNGYGPWMIEDEKLDSMKDVGNPPMLLGTLQKISEDGDSLWLRSFSIVRDTNLKTIEHIIRDITYAPDGGYILYGDITYNPRPGIDTANNYHGWLLKVDKDGCFVPGCGDTTNTVNILENIQVKIYPNPTSDQLFVFQKESRYTEYTITDISGRKLTKWVGKLSNHTYIVDVSKYEKGMYILNIVDKDGKTGIGKFVVE